MPNCVCGQDSASDPTGELTVLLTPLAGFKGREGSKGRARGDGKGEKGRRGRGRGEEKEEDGGTCLGS